MQIYQPNRHNLIQNDIHSTPIPDVYFISQTRSADQRGWYSELTRIKELNQILPKPFVVEQLNLSHSKTGVIRGIHAENWSKLITPLRGEFLAVLVDLRPDSSTFKQTLGFSFSSAGNTQPQVQSLLGCIYIPPGVGNSFCVTHGPVDYLYAVDQLYKERDATGDVAISVFDPDLNISWPISRSQMIISKRDQDAISMREKFGPLNNSQ